MPVRKDTTKGLQFTSLERAVAHAEVNLVGTVELENSFTARTDAMNETAHVKLRRIDHMLRRASNRLYWQWVNSKE